jgi:hypothetical protein
MLNWTDILIISVGVLFGKIAYSILNGILKALFEDILKLREKK